MMMVTKMIENTRRAFAMVAVTFACATLAACSSPMPKAMAPDQLLYASQSADPADLAPYRMQVGDKVSVKFYRNPELDQEDIIVRPDGKISLPFVDEVLCAGKTPAELDAELTAAYQGELTVPDITVIVHEFGGNKVYVDGDVGRPGEIPLSGGMTVFQAIQAAGGITQLGNKNTAVLVRTAPDGTRTGYAVNIRAIRSGQAPQLDVPLKPYDIVHVPHSGIGNANEIVKLYIQGLLPIRVGGTPF